MPAPCGTAYIFIPMLKAGTHGPGDALHRDAREIEHLVARFGIQVREPRGMCTYGTAMMCPLLYGNILR